MSRTDVHSGIARDLSATRTRANGGLLSFRLATYLFLAAMVVFLLFPMLWLANLSIRPQGELFGTELLPSQVQLGNYVRIFSRVRLAQYLFNSTVVACGTLLVTLSLGALAAYAFARWPFPGRDLLLFIFIFSLTIPGLVNLVAIYTFFQRLNLLNSYLGLIIVYAGAGLPVTTWLLRAYFQTLPRELEDAALIDGCSRLGAFVRVAIPAASPGFAAAALLNFVHVWQEFIVAQTLISKTVLRTVTQGLFELLYSSQYATDYTGLAAAAVVVSVPVVLLFVLLQERFVAGLTAGAVK